MTVDILFLFVIVFVIGTGYGMILVAAWNIAAEDRS